jgi:hypothetical protein
MSEAVQAKQNRGQAQQAPGARAAADPFQDPAEYLASRGWRCLGNPAWSTAGWLDPEKPLKGFYESVPRMRRVPDGNGGWAEEQVMAQTGDGQGTQRPVVQLRWNPPAEPVGMQEALLTQMERDAAARDEDLKAQARGR